METFLVLLAIIFLPFVWFITKALRYTARNVGQNSPFARTVTVRWSAGAFFTRLELIGLYVLMGIGLLLLFIAMGILSRQPDQVAGFLFLFLMSMGAIGFGLYAVNIQAKLWELIRHRSVSFDPATRQVTISEHDRCRTIAAPDVATIEHHIDNRGGRGPMIWFYTLILSDGQRYSIHDLLLPIDIIDHYFPSVPRTTVARNRMWFSPEDDTPITELCEATGR